MRFENSSENWLSDGLNPVRFISQCEVWHVCFVKLGKHGWMDG